MLRGNRSGDTLIHVDAKAVNADPSPLRKTADAKQAAALHRVAALYHSEIESALHGAPPDLSGVLQTMTDARRAVSARRMEGARAWQRASLVEQATTLQTLVENEPLDAAHTTYRNAQNLLVRHQKKLSALEKLHFAAAQPRIIQARHALTAAKAACTIAETHLQSTVQELTTHLHQNVVHERALLLTDEDGPTLQELEVAARSAEHLYARVRSQALQSRRTKTDPAHLSSLERAAKKAETEAYALLARNPYSDGDAG